MPDYQYLALKPNGEKLRGRGAAADPAALGRSLRRDGMTLLSAREAGGWVDLVERFTLGLGRPAGLGRQEIAVLMRELVTMLAAGESLDRALRFVRESAEDKRLGPILDAVREKVRHGAPLSTALIEPPASVPKLYVSLVRAGEASGAMVETLGRLADLIESQIALRSVIVSALIYPAVLSVAAMGAVYLLLGYVLPQFVPMFQQNGVALPTATRLLLELGTFVSKDGPYMLLGLLALVILLVRLWADPAVRRRADHLILRLPVVGPLMREVEAARFCRTLGLMIGNGAQLITTLDVIRDTLGNQAAIEAVEAATEVARGGGGLAKPLGAAGVFPTRTIQLIRLGEETGKLASIALQAADIHETRVRTSVQRLMGLLLPAITLAMGLMVAGIIGSLMISLMSLNDLAG
jgi:general secretion pathway protein F